MKHRQILVHSSSEASATREMPRHVSEFVPVYCAMQTNHAAVGKCKAGFRDENISPTRDGDDCRVSLGRPCPLYGNFYECGVSIDWHDFELASGAAFEWSRHFRSDSLELCLNLAGRGFIRYAGKCVDFAPLTAGFYAVGKSELKAWRTPGERHCFITVGFSAPFLRQYLSQCDGALHALVNKFVSSRVAPAALGDIRQLTTEQGQIISQLVEPHSSQRACQLWYQGKVLQLIADFFFERRFDKEVFCTRQKRTAQERVKRVVVMLREDLAAPPTLEEISREVGCSSFYLSRTFSRETGMTIPQYLRKLRMEYAAELLKSGKCNVTEAAMEVGYSSLSHFSQTFCQIMGCCPALYPLGTAAQGVTTCAEPCSASKEIRPDSTCCNTMDLYTAAANGNA